MSQNADTSTGAPSPPPPLPELPDTDDPVVLRELLRQAREHLRMRESIEQLMADNVARTEALLVESRAAQHGGSSPDVAALGAAVDSVRASLREAMSSVERLAALVNAARPPAPTGSTNDTGSQLAPNPSPEPRTIEVLMHQVHTPALARSAQQYLLGVDGVTGAEVRELAEGLLRITVVSSEAITGDTLAGWERDRGRTIRTANADVLELELDSKGG